MDFKGSREFVRVHYNEECGNPKDAAAETRRARKVPWSCRSDQRTMLHSKRKDAELPRLPRADQRKRHWIRSGKVGIERDRKRTVLVHPSTLNQFGIDAEHLFAEHAEWAPHLLLALEHGVHLSLAQDPLRHEKFSETWNSWMKTELRTMWNQHVGSYLRTAHRARCRLTFVDLRVFTPIAPATANRLHFRT